MDVAEPPPKRIRLSPPPLPSSNSAREPVIADSTDPSPAPPPAPPAATTAEELPPPNPGAELPESVASSPLSAINSDGDLPRSGGHEDTTGMTTVEDGEPKEDDAWRRGGGPADETGDEGPSSTAVDAGEANADDTDADATPVASTPAPPLVGSATALGIAAPSESSPLDSGTRQEALSTRDGTTDDPQAAPQAVDTSAFGDPVATPGSTAAALTAPATEETLGSLPPPQPTAAASIAAGPVSSPPVQHASAPGAAPAPVEEEAVIPSALGEDALMADALAAASGGLQGGTAPLANAAAESPAAAPATAAIASVQGEAPLKDSTASPAADPTGTDQTPPDPLPPPASIPSEPASSTQPQVEALASAASSNAPVVAPPAAESAPVSAPENPAPFADASNPAPTPAAIPQPAAVPVPIRVSGPEPEPEPEPEDPFTVPQSEAYRAVRAASQWNSLLGWARSVRLESSPGGAERGWDFATGMYHVPRNSPAYTANVPRATPESLAASSSKKPLPALSLHSTPSSMLYSQNPDVANLSDDDGPGTGGVGTPSESLFTESGRPRRSRAAMTRG
ncbi:hypothetical protein BMF94_2721 [Rhodotorula taiwanensis]|uniref:Uncharacterized protein n=1 Tax=Rhodotorula taiwanensis TaxID=741276 RepID=A0A2S5BC03_9BASI|nr:hypothetical protein BMF94_2721 [Rhodotorula taiwanensis]